MRVSPFPFPFDRDPFLTSLTAIPSAFYSHHATAHDFFRVGQVFMMLWDVKQASMLNLPADEEPSIQEDMDRRNLSSNLYMGPYTGPTTVRRFLVVREGIRSCYCL